MITTREGKRERRTDIPLRIEPDQVGILGVPITNLSLDGTVEAIDALIEKGGFHQVATANLDFLTKAIKDEELREILRRCDLVVADGMPLVWASRMMRMPLKERVTGADLLPRLADLSVRKGRSIFLLGGQEERSRAGSESLLKSFPGCRIAGMYSPPLGSLDELDHEHILDLIEEAAPDILLVAFGNPKQEKWLAMHRHRLRVPVCIGVGASLDFLSGSISRAPDWMQKHGMEWFFRFVSEPRRLAGRYLSNLWCVLKTLSLQVMTVSLQEHGAGVGSVGIVRHDNAVIATIDGRLAGASLERLRDALNDNVCGRDHLILDLSKMTSLGADALGLLASVGAQMAERRSDVWLVGVQSNVRRVLRTSLLFSQPFRIAAKVNDVLRRVNSTAPLARPRQVLKEAYSYEIPMDTRIAQYTMELP